MSSLMAANSCVRGIATALSSLWGAGTAATPGITPPVAAAWLYMSDDQNYSKIPADWFSIEFQNVDVLFVGPAGLQADGTFGLYSSEKAGPLAHRFRWVLEKARARNPDIKIVISQWWGTAPDIWGRSLSDLGGRPEAIDKYAASVRTFLEAWLPVSGGVDGYDVDYEDNNAVSSAAAVLKKIRSTLDRLSQAEGGRPFYVTATPATTEHLGKAVPSLSFVNMQTYAGGSSLTPQAFLDMKLKPEQLLYGICPETNCGTPTLEEVEEQYSKYKLGGIHLYRLNSDNHAHEGRVQAKVYSFLHGQG